MALDHHIQCQIIVGVGDGVEFHSGVRSGVGLVNLALD